MCGGSLLPIHDSATGCWDCGLMQRVDPFADANAEDSSAGTKEYVHDKEIVELVYEREKLVKTYEEKRKTTFKRFNRKSGRSINGHERGLGFQTWRSSFKHIFLLWRILWITCTHAELVREREELSDDEVFLVCALGWCIEWLQAYFLALEDIMDNLHARQGQPCWLRVPKSP
ncbi:hypothetical protein Vadar_023775 [Vaccinium darrowii]|uniref:Uncharacterized protein n=1 Tax=Vaccinium darrowii TaxID=229202 RepID=A0ACB7XTF8_9ERIC|nr:hypothetical protein Vadar_023775 [Vaccinium darrowii]